MSGIVEIPEDGYIFTFDENSPNWGPNVEANVLFVRGMLNHMTNVQTRRGHLFVNEVLDALGLPRTRAGVVTGWIEQPQELFEVTPLYQSNKIVIRIMPEDVIWDKI